MATSSSKPSSKHSKSPSQPQPHPTSKNPSLSSYLAMAELKSRILSSLSKLSDRDTHQIAVDDLEKIIRTLPSDGVPMLLNSLLHDPDPTSNSPTLFRRESLRLVALLASSHPDAAFAHLPKIISHIVRRLKDSNSDSSVRDACRDAAGSLAGLYIRADEAGGGSSSPVVTLFLKPLLELMGEQNKAVQVGAAMSLAKVVECGGGGGGGGGGVVGFQRLCPRICKLIGGQSFLAKGALLSVVSSLSQELNILASHGHTLYPMISDLSRDGMLADISVPEGNREQDDPDIPEFSISVLHYRDARDLVRDLGIPAEIADIPVEISDFKKNSNTKIKYTVSTEIRTDIFAEIQSKSLPEPDGDFRISVGAISPQSMPVVLQSIRECLENSDWATRKAAADTFSVLVSHSSHLVADGAASTIASLEACRFDKVKPVRDSMMEALQLWKKITGMGDGMSEDPKDGKNCESTDTEEKLGNKRSNPSRRLSESVKDSSAGSSPIGSDSVSKEKGSNIPNKAVVILKKKAPSLTDKELNPEFFHKLETRSSDDLPVEVVVPRKCLQSSHSQGEEEPDLTDNDSVPTSNHNGMAGHKSNESHGHTNANYHNTERRLGAYNKPQGSDDFVRDKWTEQRGFRAKDSKGRAFDVDDRAEQSQKDPSAARVSISRTDGHAEGSFMNNKGNWLAMQRQLSQLERQQANLMNMLQDFIGGSHDGMVTLENRVRGLERVVEEMARDLAVSSGRRGGNMMLGFEGSPGRSSSKYNGLNEYSKFGRGGDSRMPFAERFLSSDSIVSGVRGRDPPWRSGEACEFYSYTAPRNGLMISRRGLGAASVDGRSPRSEHDSDQVGSRRAWDKGQSPFRLGEGPSARSVWQASKDEATLEAIRVAGEDNGTSRIATRGAIRELDGEALTDDNSGQDRGPLWSSWTRAMDSLHVGDVDSAYAEVLSTGDDLLLVRLMERSGPVVDQLSNEIASEVLHAVGQFLLEQSLSDIALTWIQQLAEVIVENGADFLGIPLEGKREILLSIHEASAMDPPEDWDGAPADQIMVQLASAWGINIQQLIK